MKLVKLANSQALKLGIKDWCDIGITAGWLVVIEKKEFREFLKENGYVLGKGGRHEEKWVCKGKLPVAISHHGGKDLNPVELPGDLRRMGVTLQEFKSWYDSRRSKKKKKEDINPIKQ